MTLTHSYQHQSGSFQAESLKDCTLSFCLQPGLLAYAVLSKEGKIIALKEYRTGDSSESEMMDAALLADPIFGASYANRIATSAELKFALVPNEEFGSGNQHEIARHLLAPDSADHYVETSALPSIDAVAVFTVPIPFVEACSRLGNVQHRPLVNASIPMALMLAAKSPQHILITSAGEKAILTVVKDRKVQFCNLADAATPENLLYFCEIAAQMAGLSSSGFQVFFCGINDSKDQFATEFKELIPGLIFPVNEFMSSFETQSEKLPVWKYCFLSF